MGYEGDAKQGFLDEVKHWNEMCDAGYDSDWGADASMMHFKIQDPPFFAASSVTGGNPPAACASTLQSAPMVSTAS